MFSFFCEKEAHGTTLDDVTLCSRRRPKIGFILETNTLRRRPAIAYIAEASLLIFDTAFFIGILHAHYHSMFPGFKTFASNSLFFLSTPVLSSGFPPSLKAPIESNFLANSHKKSYSRPISVAFMFDFWGASSSGW